MKSHVNHWCTRSYDTEPTYFRCSETDGWDITVTGVAENGFGLRGLCRGGARAPKPAAPTTLGTPAPAGVPKPGMGNLGNQGPISADDALKSGQEWLGPGYSEVGPKGSGVFRSADGKRQFRMTDADLDPQGHGAKSGIGSHVHFEALDARGKVIENMHVPIYKGIYNMKLFATITNHDQMEMSQENVRFVEISDEEEEGMYFLFYYDIDQHLLADYCLFSLAEAKSQAAFDCGLSEVDWK